MGKLNKIRVEKALLEDILVMSSLLTKGKPVFDPIQIAVTEEGIKVAMSDPSMTLAVIAEFTPAYFDKYENPPMGVYQISAFNLMKAIRRVGKGEPYAEISFSNEQVIVELGTAVIRDALREQDIKTVEKYEKFKGIPVMVQPYAAYEVEMTELRDLDLKDSIKFEFDKNLKVKGMLGSTLEIEKNLTIKPIKKPAKPVTAEYSADYVSRISRAFRGKGVIGVVVSEDGEVGPIIMGTTNDKYTVAYWLVPMVST